MIKFDFEVVFKPAIMMQCFNVVCAYVKNMFPPPI